jgi:stage V sporulation protein SpoVS
MAAPLIPADGRYADLKIARITNVKNLAASVSKHIQQGKIVRMTSIGAGSISQMMKACACTLQYLAPLGFQVRWRVYWADKPIPDDVPQQEGRRNTWSAIVVESDVIH